MGFPTTVDINPTQTDDQSTEVNNALLTLDQVKGAFESEAETHILQAIENNERIRQQHEERSNRLDDKDEDYTSFDVGRRNSLLAGVPSNALRLFEHITSEDNNHQDVVVSDTTAANEQPASSSTPLPPPKTLTPSTSTRFTLKDAANRVRMMNLAAAQTNRVTEVAAEENEYNGQIQQYEEEFGTKPSNENRATDGDPESQSHVEDTILPESASSKFNKKGKKRFHYRYHCAPFYSFSNFLRDHWSDVKSTLKLFFLFMIPCLGLSAILYYFAGNPIGPSGGSYSWWLQFFVRLSITFVLAEVTQFILIDFICLETKLAVLAIGRMLTLMAMQAKGWPLICIFWSLWNFTLLYGNRGSHWLTFDHKVFNMFNSSNPSAVDFLSSGPYQRILITAIIVGVIVMVKRLLFSLVLGKRTCGSFGVRMESMMYKVLLIGEVAMLAQEIEYAVQSGDDVPRAWNTPANKWLFDKYKSKHNNDSDHMEDHDGDNDGDSDDDFGEDEDLYKLKEIDDNSVQSKKKQEGSSKSNSVPTTAKKRKNAFFSNKFFDRGARQSISELRESDRDIIASLLGEWEEPQIRKKSTWKDVSIRRILQFREALDYLDGKYPLSAPFGAAETRVQCMVSAQRVYQRLLKKTPDTGVLHFDTLATLAIDKRGKLNKEKARALIRLFRPDRNGNLTLLDFVKSCDNMYKKVTLFRVATDNSVQLDKALERICNGFFYLVLAVIVAMIFRISPMEVFTALTGLLLPLSFLFSSAASKYFEGLLLVLARQPYDIGDRIAISDPESDTSPSGSTTWFVDGISLFTTTVRNAATNEVATYNNGSLASSRIINAARSPKAIVYIKLKFGIDVPYEKIKIFGTVVENFIKDRPREWIKLGNFRATAVEADLGYISYILVLNHVEKWQNLGIILVSHAKVASFCLEVSKQMDMRFIAPPMPIDLRMEPNRPVDGFFPTNATNEVTGTAAKQDAPNMSILQESGGMQRIQNLFNNSTVNPEIKKTN